MEGQGTIAREIAIQFSRNPGVEQFLDIPAYEGDLPDFVICPVGGGGLITGVGTYFNYLSGKMKNGVFVVGAQNEAADAMFNTYNDKGYESTDMAKKTVADGICVKVASEVMSQLVRNVGWVELLKLKYRVEANGKIKVMSKELMKKAVILLLWKL